MGKIENVIEKPKRRIFIFFGPEKKKALTAENLSKVMNLPKISLEELLKGVEISKEEVIEQTVLKEKKSSRSGKRKKDKKKDNEDTIMLDKQIEQLKDVISNLFSKEIYKDGVIFEDIQTEKFERIVKFIKVLLLSPENEIFLYVFSPKEKEILMKRLQSIKEKKTVEVEENKIEDISEEEYDNMSEFEKEVYLKKLKVLRKCKKENRIVTKEIEELEKSTPENELDIASTIKEIVQKEIELKKQMEQQKKKKKRKSKKKDLEKENVFVNFREMFVLSENDNELERSVKLFKQNFKEVEDFIIFENDKEERIFFHILSTSEKTEEDLFTELWSVFPGKEKYENSGLDVTNSLSSKPKLEIPDEVTKQILKFPTTESYDAPYVFNELNKLFHISKDGEENESFRWIIEKKSSLVLKISFYSKFPMKKTVNHSVKFCCDGSSTKEYVVDFSAKCKIPEIQPKKIFSSVVKSSKKRVVKKYNLSEKYFGFGSLLILPDYSEKFEKKKLFKKYYENFIFQNDHDLECKIDFSLEKEGDEGFVIENPSLVVPPKSKNQMRLFCLPKEVGTFSNTIICCIENNPIPYKFDVRFTGAKPELEVSSEMIDFGKLLLSEDEKRMSIKIKNTSTIPIEWKVNNKMKKIEELTIFPLSGKLKPDEQTEIFFELDCKNACEISTKIFFEISDLKKKVKERSKDVQIIAETYNLKVNLQRNVNFGVVKVSEEVEKTIEIKNEGKYPVKYKFQVPTRFKKYFSVTPMEGLLQGTSVSEAPKEKPGSRGKKKKKKKSSKGDEKTKNNILIKFKTKKEINFKRNGDIMCEFFDPEKMNEELKTLEKLGESNLLISLKARYNKFEISPVKGINFGPLFSGKSITKTLTIFNKGHFPFEFDLFDYENPKPKTPSNPPSREKNEKEKKRGKSRNNKKRPKAVKEDLLEIGDFSISPVKGSIESKNSAEITVQFNAVGSSISHRVLGINVSDRNPKKSPNGLKFDLKGKSCVSGIETSDYDNIFEEQDIVEKLNELKLNQSGFCVSEKIFTFGVVTAKRKVTEKFKISNIMLVPCDVECEIITNEDLKGVFEVSPKKLNLPSHEHQYVSVTFCPLDLRDYNAVFQASVIGGEKTSENTTLTVNIRGSGALPQVSVISPSINEKDENNNYLLKFKRTLLGTSEKKAIKIRNKGVLDATVKFSMKHFNSLNFDDIENEIKLRGGESKSFIIEFYPTQIEKIDSILEMTVLENLLLTKPIAKTENKKKQKVKAENEKFKFENEKFRIVAEGYEEDIIFANLPKDLDYLSLENCGVGKKEEVQFQIESNCKYPVKFEWDDSIENLTISPKIGHLHPGKSKDVFLTFFTPKPIARSEKPKKLKFKFEKIQYEDDIENVADWDDKHTKVKWVKEVITPKIEVEKSPVKKKSRKGSRRKKSRNKPRSADSDTKKNEEKPALVEPKTIIKKVNEVYPEPANKSISEIKVIDLPVEICADYAQYELSINPNEKIWFLKTYIFSTTKYSFTIKNTGKVELKYRLEMDDNVGAFLLEGELGELPVGEEKEIVIKYCPKFVGKHETNMWLTIPNQENKELTTQIFSLHGNSSCPVVHFELNPSDYLTANRRDPELSGLIPDVNTNTKVIELNSSGKKNKSTKRFYVLNPTNTLYKFFWKRIYPVSEPGKKTKRYFKCKSKKGVIKSGKKYEMVFEFMPEVVSKESLWKFFIPERNLEIPFLFVGHAKKPSKKKRTWKRKTRKNNIK